MASAIVSPLLAAEPFEEAVDGPRSPTSEKEMQLFYEEQGRQDTQRRLSKRNSRKSWRRSFVRTNSKAKTTSEPDSEGYGTGVEGSTHPRSPSPGSPTFSPPSTAPATPNWAPSAGVGAFRKPGRSSTSPSSSPMSLPPLHVVRDQSHIPWHLRKYEIYQPPAFGARAPPRYFNYHLLSASARERLQRELAQGYGRALPSLTGSVFSGVGSGMGGSVRSSLSVRRPSFVGMSMGGSAGLAGLETITASPASTAAPLHSPSLDPTSALNNGPAASHRLSTWLKRPPASPHTSTQPLPTDATDLMDGTDPFGSMWHHSSPYDAGEMVVGRPGRSRDSGSPETPHSRPGMLSPAAGPSTARKGPSPLSQSTSAINLTDPEPPLPEPPGSPDLLSQARRTRKLSKRRSTSATRGGLSSLFTRKTSVEDDSPVDGRGGLRGRSRPPLSPSSLSLAQTQGIAFPTGSDGHGEKRPRRKLSKRGRSGSMSSAASMDSAGDGRSIETPIHTQFARDLPDLTRAGRDVEIIELPSAKEQTRSPPPRPLPQAQPPPRPASQQPPPHPHYYTTHEPPSSAPPATHYGPPPPSVTTNKPHRERKISAASINSFLSRITSRDKDKDKEDKRDDSDRKVAPHTLLNHVGKQRKGERGSVFGRIARKLSLIRRRSVDVFGTEANASTDAVSRPSFQVERRPPPTHPASLQRRATLDLAPSRTPTYRHMHPNESQPQMHQPQQHVRSSGTDLFAPIDPQLRSSRLINAPLSPPPRLDLAIAGDRSSWASLRRHVSNAHLALADLDEKQPPPIVTSPTQLDAPLLPPPPIGGSSAGGKHPDSPHSIPKWGIANGPEKGPALLMNGSPTDDSPMSLPKTVLTIANPDIGPESEGESIRGKHKRESYVERNRALPPEPTSPPLPPLPAVVYEERRGRESVKPLVVRKDLSRSRTPSPVKPSVSGLGSPSGRESPIKRGGRESPVKKTGRESPVKRREKARESRREMSPVKPIRRTEPLKDHSAPQVFKHVDDVGSPGMSLRTSAAMGSTTSVDAIHGDDDAEFGAKPVEQDANGRVLRRSRASMDSIGKMHVITPKTSLQKIRVRVVSNPPPVEIAKESSPVKEDAPALVASESVADSRPSSVAEPSARPRPKSRARSGYTGRDSRQSMYGTAWSESTDEYRESLSSPVGPRKRLSTADPANLGKGSPRMHSKSPSADMHSKLAAMDVRSKSPPMDVRSKSPPVEVRSKSPPVDVRSKSPPGDMHYKSGSADTHYKSASADTHPTFSSLDIRSKSPADFKTATPYMTPTDEHAPLHPFSEKPVAYHNMMAPVVMRVETTTPPLPPSDSWSKLADLKAELMNKTGVSSPKAGFSYSDAKAGFSYADSKAGVSDSKAAFLDSKGAWMDDSYDLPPPKAPFMNEEFSVSKEKLAAQGEFKKANGHHKRESTAESERDRDRERRRAREEREAEARRERERLEREAEAVRKEREAEAARAEAARKEREQERARRDRERAERERERERERQERERLDREHAERAERERQERERLRQEARAERLRAEQERLERERAEQERQERQERERLERERLERLEREREEKERIRQERIRAARQKELELERERERERIKDQERIARERDRERVEKERLERERLELERERIERERAEAARAEWERVERERRAEEMRRQERETPQPPPLIHASSSNIRRARHEADGEREVHVVTMKDMRKASRRRTPSQSRSTSPTSTAPPPPPKDERSKGRQRSQTEGTYNVPITSAIPPTPQPAIEVIRGVPVLPQGTHVEVVQPFHSRPISENNVEAPSLKARDAWERDRLDKGQSVLGPGAQRAVIPDIGSPRPAPDPRQRQPSSKSRSQPVVNQEPYVLPPVPMHPNSAVNVLPARPAYPTTATAASFPRSHNPLPKPPTIDGPFPLHRPGRAYANPNRQQSATARPRNPLPEPPRVSSYPVHHNVSPPRGVPPGAVR